MSKKIKTILLVAVIAVAVVVGAFWLMSGDVDHIEDTNGADNFSLQQITDENIVKMDIGARGLNESTDSVSNTVTYSSEKFTGVSEIWGTNMKTNRFEMTVNHAKVTEGNLRILLVVDDEIVHEFTLNELTQTCVIEDVSGYISLRIAGESANFMFDYWMP